MKDEEFASSVIEEKLLRCKIYFKFVNIRLWVKPNIGEKNKSQYLHVHNPFIFTNIETNQITSGAKY